MDGRIRKPGHDPGTLLRLSETFLRRRQFDKCRKYAHQVYQTDPNFPGASEILAVADVLLAANNGITTGTLPDWYEIMQVNRYSQNSDLITKRFNHLYGLLNPSSNKFPFAEEAFNIICDVWYVFSNPLKKVEYDELLKKSKGNSDFAFWTVCPYCYYLHEYPRVYFELCLRCPNDKCSKAFTCVEIDRPPADVLIDGKYMCDGFSPLGFQNSNWNPFAPLNKQEVNANDDAGKSVEISDDDEIETKRDKSVNVSGAGSSKMEDDLPTTKLNVRRKKSVAKKTKKVTGAGNRVTNLGFVNAEETDMIVRSSDNDGDCCKNDFDRVDFGGPIDLMNVGEVEFHDADDDILVSLQNDI